MTRGRLLCFAFALTAGLALAACHKAGKEQLPAAKDEMPVEQTPVSSLYEEKPGVLYERPVRTATVSPAPARTPSPRVP